MISDLHPSIPLADLIKDVKLAISDWIKEKDIYRNFDCWQDVWLDFSPPASLVVIHSLTLYRFKLLNDLK